MPTFAQRPFSFDAKVPDMLWPPGTDPIVIKAMKLMYEDIIHRAENMAGVLFMEVGHEEGPVAEMTDDEIGAFQFGAVIAVTAFSEIIQQNDLFDPQKWSQYLVEMLKQ